MINISILSVLTVIIVTYMEDDAALNEIVEIDSPLAEPVELAQEHMMGGIRKIVPKAFQCRLEFVAVYIA